MPFAMNYVMNKIAINFFFILKTTFIGPFHVLGSTASRLDPRGGSLCFTAKFPPRNSLYSFYQTRKMKGSHAVVLNTKLMGWETSPLINH